jgi:AcrR family transcriptional regulator
MRKRAPNANQAMLLQRGAKTRTAILSQALRIVSTEGLAGLTIGRLAKDLSMSKSGLFAHFRSKEALEIATIELASEVFTDKVLVSAEDGSEGLEALWNLCDRWLKHIEERVFQGGYLFTGAFFECAEQTGPVPQRIAQVAKEWSEALKTAVRQGQKRGEIGPDEDRGRIAIGLNGLLLGAYWSHLMGERLALDAARDAVLAKFQALATTIPAEVFESVRAFRRYLKKRRECPAPKSVLGLF